MELAKRDDVPVELTWDLSLIYPTEEAMLADTQKMKELSLSMEASYKGNLTDAATINHCLDDYQEVYRLITLLRSRRLCRLLQQCKPDAQRPHQQPDL